MQKTIFKTMFFIASLVTSQVMFSQVTISPDNTVDGAGACPGNAITYVVTGTSNNCNIEIQLISGETESFQADNANKKFTVTWKDIPQKAEIKITPQATSTCTEAQSKYIPVMSVSGLSPTISGCPNGVVIGKSESFDLTAELDYTFKGDDDDAEVEEYQWEIASGGAGWNLTQINMGGKTNKKAQIVTDNQNEATIRVRGLSVCGKWSNWQTCFIGRFVKPPCPIVGAPAYVVCEDTDIKAMTATVTQGLSGYTYHWTWPSGWTGNESGAAGVVTPNGLNGGTVTLVAKAYGKTSAPCTINIGLEPIEPLTKVIGDQFLCEDENGLFKLDITPPPSSTIEWAVTPSNATSPSSGTGIAASILASSTYNGSATIVFTINTPCGSKTRQKSFFVGKPKISSVMVDGLYPGPSVAVCPNGGLGSHWISLSLQGDPDNCIDQWNDFGTAYSSYAACTEFDFTFQYNANNYPPYNCVFVNAISENECGVRSENVAICPSFEACRDYHFDFEIFPNPASTTVNVKLFRDQNGDREQVSFDFVQLVDSQGNILQDRLMQGNDIMLDVSGLKVGLYYIRTWIDGGYIMEELLIKR